MRRLDRVEVAAPEASRACVRKGMEPVTRRSVVRTAVEAVLAGSATYDDLDDQAQAVVRADWSHRIVTLRSALDFAAAFEAEGSVWAEADVDGQTVICT